MFTLVYASTAVRDMTDTDLIALLDVARNRNSTEQVTGMLLYAYGSFMQQLEGEEASVRRILDSIQSDDRHRGLRLLSERPIVDRMFPDWSMGFAHPDGPGLQDNLPGYRFPATAPLVSPELVSDSATAERLLLFYATGTADSHIPGSR